MDYTKLWGFFCGALALGLIGYLWYQSSQPSVPLPAPVLVGWSGHGNWPVPFSVRYRWGSERAGSPWSDWLAPQGDSCWPTFGVPAEADKTDLQREVQGGKMAIVVRNVKAGTTVTDSTPLDAS